MKTVTFEGKRVHIYLQEGDIRLKIWTHMQPEEAEALASSISGLSGISVRGIMTMGPRVTDAEELRPYFRATRELFDRLTALGRFDGEPILSMGMSASFLVAIEEGATLVRVGTRLFEK